MLRLWAMLLLWLVGITVITLVGVNVETVLARDLGDDAASLMRDVRLMATGGFICWISRARKEPANADR